MTEFIWPRRRDSGKSFPCTRWTKCCYPIRPIYYIDNLNNTNNKITWCDRNWISSSNSFPRSQSVFCPYKTLFFPFPFADLGTVRCPITGYLCFPLPIDLGLPPPRKKTLILRSYKTFHGLRSGSSWSIITFKEGITVPTTCVPPTSSTLWPSSFRQSQWKHVTCTVGSNCVPGGRVVRTRSLLP